MCLWKPSLCVPIERMSYTQNQFQKAYAQAAAIVGAAFGSWLLFDFSPNNLFLFGTLMVAVSVYLYNGYPQERRNMEEENNNLNNEVEDDFSEKNVI